MKIKLFNKEWIFENFLPEEKMGSLEGFSIEKEIFQIKTPFQKMCIIDNLEFGRILFLNDFLQLATKGEEIYHEMLVHPALLLHKNPKKVLIIGGGDGGALREVLKHPIKEVVLVEIDEEVVKASKKYLPSISNGAFDNSRVTLIIEDGIKTLDCYKQYFDCIVLDSNDPDGQMALNLFSAPFFSKVEYSLKSDGIFILQTGLKSDTFGATARKELQKVFPFVWLHRAHVPYYMSGEHTFSIASKKDSRKTSKKILEQRFQKRNLQTTYYSSDMHIASSILPLSWKHEIEKKEGKRTTLWESSVNSLETRESTSQKNSNQE